MSLDKFACEEGKRINARIIKIDGEFFVDPNQTRADYPHNVVGGKEELEGEPPYEKLIEIVRCAENHAEVKVVGNSLRDIIS